VSFSITVDLDSILTGDDYGTTLGEVFREELKREIAKAVKEALKKDAGLKRAIAALQAHAANAILAACLKPNDKREGAAL
jgi:hypothetical protein